MKKLIILVTFLIISSFNYQQPDVFQAYETSTTLIGSNFTNWSFTTTIIRMDDNKVELLTQTRLTLYIRKSGTKDKEFIFSGRDSDGDDFAGRIYQIIGNFFVLEVYYDFGAFAYKVRKL